MSLLTPVTELTPFYIHVMQGGRPALPNLFLAMRGKLQFLFVRYIEDFMVEEIR